MLRYTYIACLVTVPSMYTCMSEYTLLSNCCLLSRHTQSNKPVCVSQLHTVINLRRSCLPVTTHIHAHTKINIFAHSELQSFEKAELLLYLKWILIQLNSLLFVFWHDSHVANSTDSTETWQKVHPIVNHTLNSLHRQAGLAAPGQLLNQQSNAAVHKYTGTAQLYGKRVTYSSVS